ncbi:MAG: flagellar protein FliS [Alphaproteobacteria bacterium]|jgi:flagellar secretion chaperone FliS|nr:flagellar protein FliS [Alphaproteobacteria bacterium]MDG2466535.1 flagellar protein FliS [Alphaproteobacteria bacterium]
MSVKKMMEAYTKTDHTNVVEGNDPVAIVALLFDELIRAMQDFIQHSDPEKGEKDVRSRQFSRSLTIIYALQTSLNFEEGGDIANNLFQLYEYARQQLLQDWKDNTIEGTEKAIISLDEIRDAWHQLSREGAPS